MTAPAKDWPQWGGTDGKNMVSLEKGLPDSFVPGEKDSLTGWIKLETAKNVRWGVKVCQAVYSTPVVAGGKVFIGGRQPGLGLLMCLDEKTGRLVATDDLAIAEHVLHGQWSSVSLGKVAGRKLVFFGGGDGRCYAFEALASVPEKPAKLKTIWSYDCIPPEYRSFGDLDAVSHYCLGDKRTRDTLNQNDGSFVDMPTPKGLFVLAASREKRVLSQINVGATIYATPVAANGTLYIASQGGWLWAASQRSAER